MINLLTFTSLSGLIVAIYCFRQWGAAERSNDTLRGKLVDALAALDASRDENAKLRDRVPAPRSFTGGLRVVKRGSDPKGAA